MKRMLKSKAGISPILATLLLIVIAVAAVIVTYAWVMTFTSSTTGQAGILLREDAVDWDTGNVTLYIRNTGTEDAIIDAVYIGTSRTDLSIQTSVSYEPSSKIVVAGGGSITITIDYLWTPKSTYYFKVAPQVGAPLEFNKQAP